jgi:hypothetical protein
MPPVLRQDFLLDQVDRVVVATSDPTLEILARFDLAFTFTVLPRTLRVEYKTLT